MSIVNRTSLLSSKAIKQPITTVTGNTTLALNNSTVRVDATSGAITISLPSASSVSGFIFNIKKIDNSVNTVTIDPSGSELIDGASTHVIINQYTSRTIQSNGSSWDIL